MNGKYGLSTFFHPANDVYTVYCTICAVHQCQVLFFLSIEIIIYHVVYGMYVCCIRFSFGLMYRGNLWCKSRAGRAIKCLNANIAHLCKLLCDTAFYDIEISIFFLLLNFIRQRNSFKIFSAKNYLK